MRRLLLGDESRSVEGALGRIILITLFTTLLGVALALVFLVNQRIAPVALKFVTVAALGLASGLMSRRLLAGRSGLLRFFSSIFAVLVAFVALDFLTHGFIGLELPRAQSIAKSWDSAVQLLVAAAGAWMAQRAWAGARREVMVEPRGTYEPEPLPVLPEPRPQPRRPRRAISTSLLAALVSKRDAALAWTANALGPAIRGTRTGRVRSRAGKPASRSARRRARGEIALSADEAHVCPYCLEPVLKRDPRGVKICKMCKTWHHADCWAITGVCQVPHQYVS